MKHRVLGAVTVLAACAAAYGVPVTFESGPAQAALLELFTSEGCSSCPPAETWLSKLRDDPALWKKVVPVAFHVDYWDNLGWPDRFASPVFTQRQSDYAASWKSSGVYTPCFVLNGREWARGEFPVAAGDAGELRVTVADATHVTISYKPARTLANPPVAGLAPLAGGIVSDVRRGENAGRKLPHEFVALALISTPMELVNGEWTAKFTLPEKTAAPPSALAAWVHPADDTTPLQAAGGWL
ncbi:MAG: DUF1223 domain-containing protein [Chthoniobacterales bacterium]